jgi:hypothetical protein
MKSIVIAALLGYTSAIKLAESPDHPDSNKVFSYNERSAAAAGFLQTSACVSAGHKGVSCIPSAELFAVGMNGDEDLGEDITMKGQKFHYAQNKFAVGMNGDEDLGEDITMKG